VTGPIRDVNRGIWYGIAAYSLWGLFPIYWKLFRHVPALEILAHRIAWSFVALVLLVAGAQGSALRRVRDVPLLVIGLYTAAAVLIGVNWFLYVWAVNAGFVVETSLGYFITPLVNVLLGVVVFRERLRMLQWVAVGLAAAGVLYLTSAHGSLPWIALGLAFSFGGYGLAKKKAPLGSLDGLALETAMLVVPAALYLGRLQYSGEGAFLRTDVWTDLLLAASGTITIIPLLLFASSVRRVPLSIVGILQYIAPTMQLVLGVLLFHEPFTRVQAVGFTFVWMAVVVFAVDGLRAR
jgi:chloramphenicol-sensitive protein RarD